MLRGLSAVLLALVWMQTLQAQEQAQVEEDPPALSEQELLQRFITYSTPGEMHEMLAAREGTWDFTIKLWMAPDAEMIESTGTSELTVVLDGRFLMDKTTSSIQGQPFEGLGLTGYDTIREKFVSTWMDSMSTGIMIGEGTYNEERNVIRHRIRSTNVADGKYEFTRSIERIIDEDSFRVNSFATAPDGTEFKNMEIHYTRRQ